MRGNTISRIFEMAVASLALAGLLTLPLWHVEAAEQISGQWLAEPSREGGHVMLTLQRSVEGRNHHMSMSERVSASELMHAIRMAVAPPPRFDSLLARS